MRMKRDGEECVLDLLGVRLCYMVTFNMLHYFPYCCVKLK